MPRPGRVLVEIGGVEWSWTIEEARAVVQRINQRIREVAHLDVEWVDPAPCSANALALINRLDQRGDFERGCTIRLDANQLADMTNHSRAAVLSDDENMLGPEWRRSLARELEG